MSDDIVGRRKTKHDIIYVVVVVLYSTVGCISRSVVTYHPRC